MAAPPPLLLLLCFSAFFIARAQSPSPPQSQQQPAEYRRALEPFSGVDVGCPLTVAVTPLDSDDNATFSLAVTASSEDVARAINATLDGSVLEVDCADAVFASADPIKVNVTYPARSATLRMVASRGGGDVVVVALAAAPAAAAAAAAAAPSPAAGAATAPPRASPSSPSPQPNVQPLIQALERSSRQRNASGDASARARPAEQPSGQQEGDLPTARPLVLIASDLGSTLHLHAAPPNTTAVAVAADAGGVVIVHPSPDPAAPAPLREADVVADAGSAVVVSGVTDVVRVQLGGLSRVFVRPPPQQQSSNDSTKPLQITGTCSMLAHVFLVAPDDQGDDGGDNDDGSSSTYTASCDASSAPLSVHVWPWFSGTFLGGAKSCCAPVSLSDEPKFPEPRWSCGVALSAGGGDDGGGGCPRQQVFRRRGSGQEAGFVSVRMEESSSSSSSASGGRGRGRGGGCTMVSSGRAPACSAPDEQLAVDAH